jgi:hypothetical protein
VNASSLVTVSLAAAAAAAWSFLRADKSAFSIDLKNSVAAFFCAGVVASDRTAPRVSYMYRSSSLYTSNHFFLSTYPGSLVNRFLVSAITFLDRATYSGDPTLYNDFSVMSP